jgi:hypothetical protein
VPGAELFVKADVELRSFGPLEARPLAESLIRSDLRQARSIVVLAGLPRTTTQRQPSRLCRYESKCCRTSATAPVPSHNIETGINSFGLSTSPGTPGD